MKSITQRIKEKPVIGWLLFFATVLVVFLLGLLASSIIERRAETLFVYTPKVKHTQFELRTKSGAKISREYQSWSEQPIQHSRANTTEVPPSTCSRLTRAWLYCGPATLFKRL